MGRVQLLLGLLVLLLQAAPAQAGWSLLKKALGLGWGSGSSGACKPVAPQPGVDHQSYTSKRWYIHQQVEYKGRGRAYWAEHRTYKRTGHTGGAPHGHIIDAGSHTLFRNYTDGHPSRQPQRALGPVVRASLPGSGMDANGLEMNQPDRVQRHIADISFNNSTITQRNSGVHNQIRQHRGRAQLRHRTRREQRADHP